MKTPILIVSYSLAVGGVERALLGLLSQFPTDRFDVTLALARKQGALLSEVPENINVVEINSIKANWSLLNKPLLPQIYTYLKSLNTISKAIKLTIGLIHYKFSGHYHYLYKGLFKTDNISRKPYRLAISYAGPSNLLDYYVAKVVHAKYKAAWVHYDVDKFRINSKGESILYKHYDKIFVVSETGKDIFNKKFPTYAPKSDVFHNIIDIHTIIDNSKKDDINFHKGTINIVTVGRISAEKGQELAIKALAILKKNGYNVFWTFVGGGDEKSLRKLAKELEVENVMDITGVCMNPYPYMRNCDIYVQPSLHEGYCITLAEAKIFGPPIVATDFTGAKEQLEYYSNGFIAEHSPLSIFNSISYIIDRKLYMAKHGDDNIASDFSKLNEFLC